jgi:hypothetical protein
MSGVLRDTGEHRFWVCDHADTRTCAALIAANVPAGSMTLFTDEWQSYRVLPTLAPLRSEDVGALAGPWLRRRDHPHHVGKSLSIDAPALLKRERLVAVRLGAEKRSDLVEHAIEMRGGDDGFEPACRAG